MERCAGLRACSSGSHRVAVHATKVKGHIARCTRTPQIGGAYRPRVLQRGQTTVLREALSSDSISSAPSSRESTSGNRQNGAGPSSNGSGSNGNGSNGNGSNGNGNGAYKSGERIKLDGNEYLVRAERPFTTGDGKKEPRNRRGQTSGAVASTLLADDIQVEGLMDSCEAGQLEACATEKLAEAELERREREQKQATAQSAFTTKGTPYKTPGGRWSQFRRYSTLQRTLSIWKFAFVLFFKLWLVNRKFAYGKEGMTPERVSKKKLDLAVWLREGLVKLGPTFIKIGQQFSTRVDVLSPEFVKELEKLQDNVPPFDSESAVAIVERDLGAPISETFESFDLEPIAAASLGQVHLARVKGERVVVKVQRPGLKELFDIDLKNIRVLAEWLQRVDPKSDGAARDWVAIYDECSRILYQEIDYTLEGQNADRFRECFKNEDWIKVPRVYWQYTSPQVLTLEYAPGIKINRVAELDRLGVDRTRLARLAVESYLQQLLTHGFFHADPHPGNIAVDGKGQGRLIYYDFGMMGTIPNNIRGGLLELFYGVYEKDPDRCLDALIDMGVLVPTGDRTAVRRTAEFFLSSFQERLQQQRDEAKKNPTYRDNFKPQATKEEKTQRRKQILSSIGEDLLLASADKPFRFPATFTFVVRSFTVLDGIGKGLDPRFDISEIAAPYARGLLLEAKPQFAKLAEDFKKRAGRQNKALVNLFKGPNMIENIASTMTQLERGDLKLRVRALEAERALSRVQVQQKVMTSAVVASMFVNVGTVLSVSAMSAAATASFVAAGLAGLALLANWAKVLNMEKKEAQLLGA